METPDLRELPDPPAFQSRNQVWMHLFVERSPSALAPNIHNIVGSRSRAYLYPAKRHRADRQPRRSCHRSNATPPQRICFGPCPQATGSFIHRRRK